MDVRQMAEQYEAMSYPYIPPDPPIVPDVPEDEPRDETPDVPVTVEAHPRPRRRR